ncbi:sigma-54-dependent transcriptional regulator [Desulfatiglans anilini]|uniref:sigma-54-dependent transcriptional regulator n=1 Tax=Desulfatiglans anilini TaxID=90728 RepID=UPI000403A3E4|nr:sigma-54 dependent transcriptional regulator [Desulfatiglans anilini]
MHILIVDDDAVTLKNLRRLLEKSGYRVSSFTNPVKALEELREGTFDLLVTDLRMPHMDGLSLLEEVQRADLGIEVIVMTGFASLDGAVEATKRGAYHYLAKPFTPDRLRSVVSEALEHKALRDRGARADASIRQGRGDAHAVMIGESPRMMQVTDVIRQIAPTDCNVLITGESGTGKELAARAIHALSPRAQGPFVAFNCAAFSPELIVNELFGHEKDAYTGATSSRPGLLEAANGGVLFLDEVGDMPLDMQAKLLRVLQERELLRVGGTRPIALDLRVLAATAKDLKIEAAEGSFRQDLYFRLNVVNLVLPSLRERRQDIPLLAYHMLERSRRRMRKSVKAISRQAMDLLENYHYPGNVRELENIIERAVALCRGDRILARDLPPDLAELELHPYERPGGSLMNLEELEEGYIRHILRLTGGVRSKAALILGIDRASLWRKMKKYGID